MRLDQDRELLRSLGILTEQEERPEPEEQRDPEFDGGVREPAPFSDPEEDHNA
jgi:hypothetical protein